MKIEFIKGKNIGTKDVDKRCVTLHCLVPDDFDVHSHLDRKLTMTVKAQGIKDLEIDCSISQEGSPYAYNATHKSFSVKLDVIVPDLKIIGFLVMGELHLS